MYATIWNRSVNVRDSYNYGTAVAALLRQDALLDSNQIRTIWCEIGNCRHVHVLTALLRGLYIKGLYIWGLYIKGLYIKGLDIKGRL